MKDIVTVTDNAREYLRTMLDKHGMNVVELSIDGGGCAGFQYAWNPRDSIADNCDIIDIGNEYSLIINRSFSFMLTGSEIDYTTDFSGSSLTINNPLAQSACGCGTSVSFDMEKIAENV